MKNLLTLALVLCYFPMQAQSDSLRLLAFDARINQLKKAHGRMLGSWAMLNVVAGGVLCFTSQGEPAFFQAMNLSWGMVNSGMAAFVYFHQQKAMAQPKTLLRRMDIQHHVEKVLLLNIGLDAAYILGGLAMHQHGQVPGTAHPDLWKGFGVSVMMQGTFLLLEDCIFYRLHLSNRRKMYPAWKRLTGQ